MVVSYRCAGLVDSMTALLIDIGNSRIKWCHLTEQGRSSMSASDYQVKTISKALEDIGQGIPVPQAIVIVSVLAPALEQQINHWFSDRYGIEAVFVKSAEQAWGVRNGYTDASQLGNDRWVAMVAAYDQVKGAVGVVDCGTAVTIDLIDKQGEHHGGWILPGLTLFSEILKEKTAIPGFQAIMPYSLEPGKNTAVGVAAGSLLSLVGAIAQVHQYISLQPQFSNIRWIMTGGDANKVVKELSFEIEIVDELIMNGLQLIAESRGR